MHPLLYLYVFHLQEENVEAERSTEVRLSVERVIKWPRWPASALYIADLPTVTRTFVSGISLSLLIFASMNFTRCRARAMRVFSEHVMLIVVPETTTQPVRPLHQLRLETLSKR